PSNSRATCRASRSKNASGKALAPGQGKLRMGSEGMRYHGSVARHRLGAIITTRALNMPERARASSTHISPSAHYTGYVWYRHGLSEQAFVTAFGGFVHRLLAPISWAARRGGLDIEHTLLQRHLLIDAQLTAAIE